MTDTAPPVKIWFQKHTVEGRLPGLDEAYRQHFTAVARPGTEVTIHTLPTETYAANVPEGMVRYGSAEALFSSYFSVRAAMAGQQGYNAFIIGASQDPGLQEARALADIPVLGYGETAVHLAAMTGRSIGVVGFIPELEEPIRENLMRFGLAHRVRGFAYLESGPDLIVEGLRGSPERFLAAFGEAADRLVADGAEIIMPGEGLPNEILWAAGVREHAGAAILDVDGALIKVAELLVDLQRLGSLGTSANSYRSRRLPAETLRHLIRLFQPACLAAAPPPGLPSGQ